jgi:hypothetical protein
LVSQNQLRRHVISNAAASANCSLNGNHESWTNTRVVRVIRQRNLQLQGLIVKERFISRRGSNFVGTCSVSCSYSNPSRSCSAIVLLNHVDSWSAKTQDCLRSLERIDCLSKLEERIFIDLYSSRWIGNRGWSNHGHCARINNDDVKCYCPGRMHGIASVSASRLGQSCAECH